MKRNTALPELLAPAGDMECLYAAVAAGADAVYVGGKRFGARAFAKNFDINELSEAVNYCHLNNVKLYVTLNTLVEDREMQEAVEYAQELYAIGVDALIAADLGVISAIRRHVPSLEIHASTQMSVHNSSGVCAAHGMGITRVVVARELSLQNIKSVVNNSPCEIEVFIHGALCVCHSGQCLFSSLVGGRSGNRGECAQPCRLPYGKGYPLSLKDMSLADHIPELIESGVASLKIEGRMKAPSYVYTVTKIYRDLLDGRRSATAEERELLRRAFSRGGFTDAYFVDKTNLSPMTGIRSAEDKESTRELSEIEITKKRKTVTAKVIMKLGQPSEMTVTDGIRSVTALGMTPMKAEKAPIDPDSVKDRLSKMGNTGLLLSPEDIELSMDEGIILPVSAINSLRREAAAAFESSARDFEKTEYQPMCRVHDQKPRLTAQFFSEKEFVRAVEKDGGLLSRIDLAFLPLFSSSENIARAGGVFLPPVIFDSELEQINSALENVAKSGKMYALVGNIGQIELVKKHGLVPFGDFRLNITNCETASVYEKMGISDFVLSPELTLPKARDIGGAVITYGRIPLMITERCFMKDSFGCKNCSECALTDRKGERFPMKREFSHRNIIFNSAITYMGDRGDELRSCRIRSQHLLFSDEGADEICASLRAYLKGQTLLSARIRRVGRR